MKAVRGDGASGFKQSYGESFNGKDSLWDLRIIKYNDKGETIWNIRDEAKKNTAAIGMDIADDGNLYMLGLQTIFDKKVMRLKSYDNGGSHIWEKDYDVNFEPKAMRAGKDGIYITGSRYNPQKSGWDIDSKSVDVAYDAILGDDEYIYAIGEAAGGRDCHIWPCHICYHQESLPGLRMDILYLSPLVLFLFLRPVYPVISCDAYPDNPYGRHIPHSIEGKGKEPE